MDDKLRGALDKKLGVSDFEEQFTKSFRKVTGIAPDIDVINDDLTVEAHGEHWALDGHNWLLWRHRGRWVVATAEGLADADKD